MLTLPLDGIYTRRWFYFVPARGIPSVVVSAVEPHVLHELPATRYIFRSWQEMYEQLRTFLRPQMRIAMEYSPKNAIPYVSRVDAGTVDLVRSLGAEVVSSANIIQRFIAQLNEEQLWSHREAGRRLISVKDQLFASLSEDLDKEQELDEYWVQQRFLSMVKQVGLLMPEPPIVAVNANSGNPHYEPTIKQRSPIRPGDLILFDFWARLPHHGAIFADYTWVAFAGSKDEILAQQREVFEVVRSARDTAIAFIRARLAAGERIEGREVDDVARGVIAEAGYSEYFVHRTGHNIGTTPHGDGANMDNLETQDERVLLPYTCTSIEPGIYLPEFGIRSEVNLLILEHDVEVTGVPVQEEIVPLL
jgi:Xaa-Pro aminopeptidase